jgi:DNA-binding beta-propeller fold protein YncE
VRTEPSRRRFLLAVAALAAAAPRVSAQQKRVRTVAGTGKLIGEDEVLHAAGVPALEAPVSNPYGIVDGPDGAIYYCEVDTGCTRRLDPADGRVTTIAGTGKKGYAGDGGPAPAASFSAPHEIRFDREEHLYVVERDSHVVRRIDARTRMVSTVAGTGTAGFSGDGGPAARAQLRQPHSIAFDADGRLLICDIGNSRIRAVDMRSGVISTYAGTGERRPTPDEGPLDGSPLNGPRSIDTDPDGNVYLVLREGNAIFRIDRRSRRLTRIAGTGETGFSGDGGLASDARFNGPKGIAYSGDQSLYVVDTENHAIRRIDLKAGTIATVLGTGQRGDGPEGDPLKCAMARPHGVLVHRGAVYVTDSENHRIRALE